MANDSQAKLAKVQNVLKQARGRRTSVMPPDKSGLTENAASAWDVASVYQVQQFAKDHPEELLTMIENLRIERDNLVQVGDWYIEMRTENDQLRTKLAKYRTQSPRSGRTTTRTHKLPDSPIFRDDGDPTWDKWSTEIMNKLITNADHFPTDELQMAYIHTRLGGKPSDQVLAHLRPGRNRYEDTRAMMDHLTQLYEDPDRERLARI